MSNLQKQANNIKNNVINIHIQNMDDLLSHFTCGENRVINQEFILNFEEMFLQFFQTKKLNENYKINVIVEEEILMAEQNEACSAFKNHYKKEVRENDIKIDMLNRNAAISLCISVTIFLLLHFLNEFNVPFLWINVLEVAAWVFTWQFFDNISFSKIDVLLSRRRNMQAKEAEFNVIQKTNTDNS